MQMQSYFSSKQFTAHKGLIFLVDASCTTNLPSTSNKQWWASEIKEACTLCGTARISTGEDTRSLQQPSLVTGCWRVSSIRLYHQTRLWSFWPTTESSTSSLWCMYSILIVLKPEWFGRTRSNHCWCPESLCHQVISSNDIDRVE